MHLVFLKHLEVMEHAAVVSSLSMQSLTMLKTAEEGKMYCLKKKKKLTNNRGKMLGYVSYKLGEKNKQTENFLKKITFFFTDFILFFYVSFMLFLRTTCSIYFFANGSVRITQRTTKLEDKIPNACTNLR